MKCEQVRFSGHALNRMFERQIAVDDVLGAVASGETIESYDRDRPFPSRLLLAKAADEPLHVLVAQDDDSGTCYIVTVYRPDPTLWEDGFRTRRSP